MFSTEVLFAARTDVTVEPQGEKFVLHDPRKNSFAQLGMAEYIVFRCFDGKSTILDIVDRLKRERDVTVSSDQVARLSARLHEKQLVLAPGEVVKIEDAKLAEGGGLTARLVMIELPIAWNPDVFLTRVYHRIKYVVFRPAFFVGLAVLLAMAFMVSVQSVDAIRLQAAKLDARGSFILFYVCVSATFFLHECAHGVVCRGFGGKVPKIGAFLYFSIVVYYTDVSSSWMFRSKFRKLMVLFAGAISNLALWAIATLVWRNTIQGSLINQVCFALMTINLLAATFTLFPLLRGDGYYILSTALDIPNLRQNARQYVSALVRRTFVDRSTPLPAATDREAIVYLCYAPLQIAFYIGFFGYVAYRVSSWLLGELHMLGFWILVLVVVDRIGRPVLRIVPGTLALAAQVLRLGLRDGARYLTRRTADAGRGLARLRKPLLVVAIPIIALAVIPYELTISAPFEVVSSGAVTVRANTSGIIKQYLVPTGGWVKAGDPVARLEDDELKLQRHTLAAELAEARAKLAELEAGYRSEKRASARVDYQVRGQTAAHTALELRRTRNLFAKGIASRKELDAAIGAHRSAVALAGEARSELGMMNAGPRQELRDLQCARVARAEHELALVDQKLAWTVVHAHVAGRVITRSYELEQRVGTHVGPGDGIVEIVAPADLVARLEVPERFTSDIAVTMPVTLRFYQDPAIAYAAQLDAIEPAITLRADQPTGALGMQSRLGHLGDFVPLGATGIAKVDAGSQSILGLFLRRAHRAVWVTFWSWW